MKTRVILGQSTECADGRGSQRLWLTVLGVKNRQLTSLGSWYCQCEVQCFGGDGVIRGRDLESFVEQRGGILDLPADQTAEPLGLA